MMSMTLVSNIYNTLDLLVHIIDCFFSLNVGQSTAQCLIDEEDDRLWLPEKRKGFSSTNSVETCKEFCVIDAHLYLGLQDGMWCYCGHTRPISRLAQQSECEATSCAGNSSQFCGGPWRMNVFPTG